MTSDLTGRVVAVNTVPLGGLLAADAVESSGEIYVEDAADFDPNGGFLRFEDETVVAYTSADDETGLILLDEGPGPGLLAGDRVEIYDNDLEGLVVETHATIVVEGTEQPGDTLSAIVDHSLIPYLPEGIRDADFVSTIGESVSLAWRGDDLYVVNIIGREVRFDGAMIDADTIPPNPELLAELAATQAEVDTLNTVTLPALDVTIAANAASIDSLEGRFPVTGPDIEANAITANKIDAGAVTTAKLAAGAVTANEIAAHTITANEIAAGTITADEIGAGEITTGKLAAGAIDGMTITGAVVQTAEPTVGISSIRMRDDSSAGIIEFFGGLASETPGFIDPTAGGGFPAVIIESGKTPTMTEEARLLLLSGATDQSSASLSADSVALNSSGNASLLVDDDGDATLSGETVNLVTLTTAAILMDSSGTAVTGPATFDDDVDVAGAFTVGGSGVAMSQIRTGNVGSGGTTSGSGMLNISHGGATAPDVVLITSKSTGIGVKWTGTVSSSTFETYQFTQTTGAARASATGAPMSWLAIWL
jgi:hypothetical protein